MRGVPEMRKRPQKVPSTDLRPAATYSGALRSLIAVLVLLHRLPDAFLEHGV